MSGWKKMTCNSINIWMETMACNSINVRMETMACNFINVRMETMACKVNKGKLTSGFFNFL